MRPGERTGDSGTNTNVAMVAVSDIMSGNQKSQW